MRRIPLGAGVGAPPAAFRCVADGNVGGREAGRRLACLVRDKREYGLA